MAGPGVPSVPAQHMEGQELAWEEELSGPEYRKTLMSGSRIYLHVKENSHPESCEEEKANKLKEQ